MFLEFLVELVERGIPGIDAHIWQSYLHLIPSQARRSYDKYKNRQTLVRPPVKHNKKDANVSSTYQLPRWRWIIFVLLLESAWSNKEGQVHKKESGRMSYRERIRLSMYCKTKTIGWYYVVDNGIEESRNFDQQVECVCNEPDQRIYRTQKLF